MLPLPFMAGAQAVDLQRAVDRRVDAAGRREVAGLDAAEHQVLGALSSFHAAHPMRMGMSREELRDGWVELMDRLYDAENYFERFAALYIDNNFTLGGRKMSWLRRHRPFTFFRQHALIVLGTLIILGRIWSDPRTRPFRPVYARYLRRMLRARRPVRHLFQFATRCVMHTHFAIMTKQMACGESRLVNT